MNTENELNSVINGILSHLYKNGYRFLEPDGSLQVIDPSGGKKDLAIAGLAAAAAGYCFGLLGVLSLGGDELTEESLKLDLKDIARHGLVAGFKRDWGLVYVALLVDCTGISDETLVGKLSVIGKTLEKFQKYSTSLAPRRRLFKDSRTVFCLPYLLFTEQYKADYFLTSIWGKYYKPKLFTHLHVMPVVVDVKDRRLFKYKGAIRGGFSENEYSKVIQDTAS